MKPARADHLSMATKEKMLAFNSLHQQYVHLGLPTGTIDTRTSFTIHNLKDIHDRVPYKSPVYRANFYSFVFVKDGAGKYTTDDKTYATEPGTIYFTNPGHYKSFEWHRIEEIILITLRGLGKAIAERYAALGADIVINYSRDKASAEDVVANIKAMGGKVIALQADVSKVADLEKLFTEAKKVFGKIDIVVANAGIELVETPVTDFTEEQFDRVFAINTKGTYFTLQQAARLVEDNGRIIYVASSTTSFPVPGMAVYGGSKTTPRYLVDILSKEIGHRGVTVNSIIPFAVDHSGIFADPNAYTALRRQLLDSCPMGRLAEVEDVANLAEFFASDLSSFVSGQHLLVNGGATN